LEEGRKQEAEEEEEEEEAEGEEEEGPEEIKEGSLSKGLTRSAALVKQSRNLEAERRPWRF
jgi:hypothetical protein